MLAFFWIWGAISAGWLLYLGNWEVVLIGVAALLAAKHLLWIPMIPAMICVAASANEWAKGYRKSSYLFSAISTIWLYCIVFICCAAAIALSLHWHSRGQPLFAFLLWAYVVGAGPFHFLATRVPESVGFEIAGLAPTFAMFATMLTIHFVGRNSPLVLLALAGPLAIGAIISMVLQIRGIREQ